MNKSQGHFPSKAIPHLSPREIIDQSVTSLERYNMILEFSDLIDQQII